MSDYASHNAARLAYVTRMLAAFLGGFGAIKGLARPTRCVLRSYLSSRNSTYTVKTPSGDQVFLRPRSSDLKVFTQVIAGSEYAVPGTEEGGVIDKRYQEILARSAVPLIIDGGGNIGLSARYFASRYKGSLVLVAEPDEANMIMAKRNTSDLQNVRFFQKAIWSRSARLIAIDPSAESWSFSYREALDGEEGLPAVSIDEMMSSYSDNSELFLVKLDIEGAEGEVLNAPSEWIKKKPILMVEPHDYKSPGRNLIGGLLKNKDYHDSDLLVRSDIFCLLPSYV